MTKSPWKNVPGVGIKLKEACMPGGHASDRATVPGSECFIWSKFDIQSAGVALKMRSWSPKSNHFFPMSQWSFCASLVKIHKFVQEIRVQTMLILTIFIVWWPWKLGQGRKNLINSFNYPKDTGQNPSFGSRDRVQTSFFFGQNLTFKVLVCTWKWVSLKMRSRSSKSSHFFPMSQWCFCASLIKIHQLVQEIECRQGPYLESL